MSIHNRISAIHMRMQQIQAKFGNSPMPTGQVAGTGDMAQVMQATGGQTGLTFEKILATQMKQPAGTADTAYSSNVKNFTLSNKAGDYDQYVNEAAQKYGVDAKFIKAIIQQESGFNPNATSWCGAMGMMQLMPETAKGLGVKNAYDPRENIMGGVKYIKQQLDQFGGDKEKALAAYNAGPGAVQKYGGIPPYRETQGYVKNIMSIYRGMGGV